MSHFWFFAILIEYITEKCQGGNPANGAWIVPSSFSHLFFLKSSIISELKRIKNAMLVNSQQQMQLLLCQFCSPVQTGTEKIEKVLNWKPDSEDGATQPARFRKSVREKDSKDFQKRRKFKLHGLQSLQFQYNGIEENFPLKRLIWKQQHLQHRKSLQFHVVSRR